MFNDTDTHLYQALGFMFWKFHMSSLTSRFNRKKFQFRSRRWYSFIKCRCCSHILIRFDLGDIRVNIINIGYDIPCSYGRTVDRLAVKFKACVQTK